MTKKPKPMTAILIIIAVVLVALLAWFVMNVKVMRYGPLKITIWQKILVKRGVLIIDYDRVSNTFSCPAMPEVSFTYQLSDEWSPGKVGIEKTSDNTDAICKVHLFESVKSVNSIAPYIYVTNILENIVPDMAQLPVNPHGVHYAIAQQGGSWVSVDSSAHDFGKTVDFYFDGSVVRVGLELYSEAGQKGAKPLDKELFFKSVIDSFNITEPILKVGKTVTLLNSAGKVMNITLDSIDMPKTNNPGDRRMYHITLTTEGQSQKVTYDPYTSGQIVSKLGFDFKIVTSKDDPNELIVTVQ